jgi:mono/diheme cytochrome c family protein
MRNFLLGNLTGASILVLGVILYLRLGFAETRGDLAPSAFENSVMTAAVHASVRRHAPEAPNPVPPTEENLIAGGKLFISDCSGCHGALHGAEDDSDTLFPRIPQFHKVGTEYTEAQIFWVAKHGIRRSGMFANGKWYPDKDLWAMAAYIKHVRELPPAVQKALEPKAANPQN